MTIQEAIKQLQLAHNAAAKGLKTAIRMNLREATKVEQQYMDVAQMAISALREKAEREDPKPLTYDELLQMDGELVWLEVIDISDYSVPNESKWAEVCIPTWKQEVWFWRFGNECEAEPTPKNYGKTWIAYRHKPKGE